MKNFLSYLKQTFCLHRWTYDTTKPGYPERTCVKCGRFEQTMLTDVGMVKRYVWFDKKKADEPRELTDGFITFHGTAPNNVCEVLLKDGTIRKDCWPYQHHKYFISFRDEQAPIPYSQVVGIRMQHDDRFDDV